MIHILDLQFLDIPQAIASFLVETSDGPILIETGPYSTYSNLQQAINKAGFDMADIQHVMLTHIHFDHAGAAWALAKQGATIYVHPFGVKHLANPQKLWDSAKRIYQDEMSRLWGKMQPIAESQLQAIEDKTELTFGDTKIIAHHTPGHAVHHIAYQLADVIFTGDVGGVQINSGLVEPPCPPPDINLEDWQTSIQLLKSLSPQALYLTHFGRVENVDTHLEHLEEQLTDWAEWIKGKMGTGETREELVPQFQEYVASQLRTKGADEETIQQYEAANPSWMSVAGLMRYWKKVDG
ncbi:MBL fold metallo-hydrolase [Tunicatimonas pelagia]|uniref:MBL fold metallo-hydrolase n=1 Tax=Tunicatimonas pelagia TaxID=931531 RepID=UPI002666AC1F|nr:MBL fold metallo-hydrolase [Tunicatimonas pelagia]WKN44062.1 MBL fold metallo-hydrolase [Tunicatimonas pelagia]